MRARRLDETVGEGPAQGGHGKPEFIGGFDPWAHGKLCDVKQKKFLNRVAAAIRGGKRPTDRSSLSQQTKGLVH